MIVLLLHLILIPKIFCQWTPQNVQALQQQMNSYTFPFNPNLQYPSTMLYSGSQQAYPSMMWPTAMPQQQQQSQMGQMGQITSQLPIGSSSSFPYSTYGTYSPSYPPNSPNSISSNLPTSPYSFGRSLPLPSLPTSTNPFFQADKLSRTQRDELSVPRDEMPVKAGPKRIIPPFLENATEKEKDDFYAIVQNPLWSPSEKGQKIEALIGGMSEDKQRLYAKFQLETGSEMEKKRANVHKAVEEMSDKAKAIFQRVSALMTHPDLSEKERLSKIEKIYSEVPESIKKEFDDKLGGI